MGSPRRSTPPGRRADPLAMRRREIVPSARPAAMQRSRRSRSRSTSSSPRRLCSPRTPATMSNATRSQTRARESAKAISSEVQPRDQPTRSKQNAAVVSRSSLKHPLTRSPFFVFVICLVARSLTFRRGRYGLPSKPLPSFLFCPPIRAPSVKIGARHR